jgi:hypothetical protein
MLGSEHRARVEELKKQYFVFGKKFDSVAAVRKHLSLKRLPCTHEEAYRADIDARNEGARDRLEPNVVAPAKVQDAKGNHARQPRGTADEDLRGELALIREVATKYDNCENRMTKYAAKHPKDKDVQRLGQLVAHASKEILKVEHMVEVLMLTRFGPEDLDEEQPIG